MFSYSLAEKVFEGFSVFRWNDRIRPMEFIELDKHAQKAALTYFLGKEAELEGQTIDWLKIVEGNVFGLLSKISTSDIQSNVSSQLKRSAARGKLIEFINKDYKGLLPEKIQELFAEYLSVTPGNYEENSIESKILYFAHKYTTKREFEIIKRFNPDSADITEIEQQIQNVLSPYQQLVGVEDLMCNRGNNFALLIMIENLRSQIRWSQTPRIPHTSVLGHSMYTAVLSYFASVETSACPMRIVNNFYTALFHDLPESLTRDIISPVKNISNAISDEIKQIEIEMCEKRIFSKINSKYREEFAYLLGQFKLTDGSSPPDGEFTNRVLKKASRNDGSKEIYILESGKEEMICFNEDQYSPIDGDLIKMCDDISAFMEAHMSIKYGIDSQQLRKGRDRLREKRHLDIVAGLHISEFFAGAQ